MEQPKIIAVLQARYSSTRLPGKVLLPILGKPMLQLQLERIAQAKSIDRLIVATSLESSDDPVETLCMSLKIPCYRGSLNNVLERFYKALEGQWPETVIRLTGDCPLLDPFLLDQMVHDFQTRQVDYLTNAIQPTWPDGLDVEVFRYTALQEAHEQARLPSQLEHVTPFIHSQPERYKIHHYRQADDFSYLRWTVDEPKDFELIKTIYEALYPQNPRFSTKDILDYLERKPQFKTINTHHVRNEGYQKSLQKDKDIFMQKRYQKSEETLARSLKVIPLGAQTFSKSKTQYPHGVSPYFLTKGKGSHVFDVDGNEYIDFGNSLAAITLGYSDPDVTKAVREQLEDGVAYTLSHPLEVDVAEKLVSMVPCAEMVRFGKNGSDATAGAIRVARAHTGRDHVAVCGYHGWQDWYIGSTARNLGVPKATKDLTHTFIYNNLDSLEAIFKEWPDQIAAVILEPMNTTPPQDCFLHKVADLTRKHKALLIFDETITGFRFDNGGAQKLFGVTPDLATFGKGLANGYPVSAVAGKAEYMKWMEEIFFSFTFGGECLSLAASLATMNKLTREPVIATMKQRGQQIISGVEARITKYGISDFLSITGDPTWSFLVLKDAGAISQWTIKTLLLQEMFSRGILGIGTHNLSYAHSEADVARLMAVYDEIFPLLKEAVASNSIHKFLRCEPLVPLFRIR